MSGDGLLHELLNGLASRDDWDTVLSYSCDFLPPRKNYQIILVIFCPLQRLSNYSRVMLGPEKSAPGSGAGWKWERSALQSFASDGRTL